MGQVYSLDKRNSYKQAVVKGDMYSMCIVFQKIYINKNSPIKGRN